MRMCKECNHWQHLDMIVGYCNCETSELYVIVMLKKHPECPSFKNIDVSRIEEENNALRKKISKNPNNGTYAAKICKNCEHFWTAPSSHWETAEIVPQCEKCSKT